MAADHAHPKATAARGRNQAETQSLATSSFGPRLAPYLDVRFRFGTVFARFFPEESEREFLRGVERARLAAFRFFCSATTRCPGRPTRSNGHRRISDLVFDFVDRNGTHEVHVLVVTPGEHFDQCGRDRLFRRRRPKPRPKSWPACALRGPAHSRSPSRRRPKALVNDAKRSLGRTLFEKHCARVSSRDQGRGALDGMAGGHGIDFIAARKSPFR